MFELVATQAALVATPVARRPVGDLRAALRGRVLSRLALMARKGDAAGARALLDACEGGEEERAAEVGWVDHEGRTALFHAAMRGHVAAVRVLLEAGSDPRAAAVLHGRTRTALEAAAMASAPLVVEELVKAGAEGSYDLADALRRRVHKTISVEVDRVLFKRWPPPTQAEAERVLAAAARPAAAAAAAAAPAVKVSPAVGAAAAASAPAADAAGAGQPAGRPGGLMSAAAQAASASVGRLHLLINAAAKRNDVAFLREVRERYLEAARGEVNWKDRNGSTALFHCAWSGRLDTAKALLALGADLNVRNIRGNSALHLAIEKEHTKMVRYFLERGADTTGVSVREIRKRTGRSIKKSMDKLVKRFPPMSDRQRELMSVYLRSSGGHGGRVRRQSIAPGAAAPAQASSVCLAAASSDEDEDEGGGGGGGGGNLLEAPAGTEANPAGGRRRLSSVVAGAAAGAAGSSRGGNGGGGGSSGGVPLQTVERMTPRQMARLAMGLPADKQRNTRQTMEEAMRGAPPRQQAAGEAAGEASAPLSAPPSARGTAAAPLNAPADARRRTPGRGGGGGGGSGGGNKAATAAGADTKAQELAAAMEAALGDLPVKQWKVAHVLAWLRVVADESRGKYSFEGFDEAVRECRITGLDLLGSTESSLSSTLDSFASLLPAAGSASHGTRNAASRRLLWRNVFRLQQQEAMRRVLKFGGRKSVIDVDAARRRLAKQHEREARREERRRRREAKRQRLLDEHRAKIAESMRRHKERQLAAGTAADAEAAAAEVAAAEKDLAREAALAEADLSSASSGSESDDEDPAPPPSLPAVQEQPQELHKKQRQAVAAVALPPVRGATATTPTPRTRRASLVNARRPSLNLSAYSTALPAPAPPAAAPPATKTPRGARIVLDRAATAAPASSGAGGDDNDDTAAVALRRARSTVEDAGRAEENKRLARLQQQLAEMQKARKKSKTGGRPRKVKASTVSRRVAELHRGVGQARRKFTAAVDVAVVDDDDDDEVEEEEEDGDDDDKAGDRKIKAATKANDKPVVFDSSLTPLRRALTDEHRTKLEWIFHDVDRVGRGELDRADLERFHLFLYPHSSAETAAAEAAAFLNWLDTAGRGQVRLPAWVRAWRKLAEKEGADRVDQLVEDYAAALDREAEHSAAAEGRRGSAVALPVLGPGLDLELHRRVLSGAPDT